MLKKIWYHLFKTYIGTGLFFFFKKIKIYNEEYIPEKGAVLLVSNHKNALLDPLIIATAMRRDAHFLARASAFKLKPISWFLSSLNMIPIYRIRDGKDSISKNEAIFNKCSKILKNKQCLLIFPEGTHFIKRSVQPLKKGFARITFGTLEKHPDLQIHILPIGINFTKQTLFGESVSLYFGKPFLANNFYKKNNLNGSIEDLKKEVSDKLKQLTTHIEDQNYDKTIAQLGNVDFLKPKKVNELIKELPNSKPKTTPEKEPTRVWKVLKLIVAINSFIPLLIYKSFVPKIKEIEFISTAKFGVGITAFPLFYTLQSLVIHHFFGGTIALIYLVISVVLVLAVAKTK